MADISILVADGQRLFAESLASALGQVPDFAVIPEQPVTGVEVLQMVQLHQPAVVLIDYWMPGMSGPATARALKDGPRGPKVLLLSWFHGPLQVQEALEAGVRGFLPKSIRLDQLVEGIRQAVAGHPLVYAEELARMIDGIQLRQEEADRRCARLATLTPREIEILQFLSEGWPLKSLAPKLSVTIGTLKNHIHSILKKTGTENQLEAINMARHEGLIRTTGPPRPVRGD